MVKIVSGSFRMALHEMLLQLMQMLPMRHHVEKLTHTSALHLYKLPQASQLLCHLGPEWYVPGWHDFPPVVTCPPDVARHQILHPTALEALAAKVPSDGPHVNVIVIAPWEVPNWLQKLPKRGVLITRWWAVWLPSFMRWGDADLIAQMDNGHRVEAF
ncbi:hypothetical protein EI94DRAFT_1702183 [Lactarius quietus]|nr:hypothetical protein EI94DRAFT_1702183 [Lactarius quietus]